MALVRTTLHCIAVLALAAVPIVVLTPTDAGAVTATFTTVGSSDWIVPDGVSCVTATAIGAEGGLFVPNESANGAVGGSGASTFAVWPGLTVRVNVGGRGGDSFSSGSIPGAAGTGGANGGADGGLATAAGAAGYFPGAGGGGASDVRVGGTDLDHRVVVGGGGGGGGGFDSASTGVGGGAQGGSALDRPDATGGAGGSQSAGGAGGSTIAVGQTGADGSFGVGGPGGGGGSVNGGGGGGGGGRYGGGGGAGVPPGGGAASGGGGGSGFGDHLAAGVDAGNGGNGRVTLAYEVGDTECLAHLTVEKVTSGPTTPGQTFTVHVSCPAGTIAAGPTGQADVDLAFTVDGAGAVQPAAGRTIGLLEGNDCTVTETGTGGATRVSYACTGSAADIPDQPCPTVGRIRPGQRATVTVTNTFTDTVPALAPAVAPAPAIAAVTASPRFTG
jgi:hypothetical protein